MSAFMIDREEYLAFAVRLHRFCNAPIPPHHTCELLRSLWWIPPANTTSTWDWRVNRLVRLMMLSNQRAVWHRYSLGRTDKDPSNGKFPAINPSHCYHQTPLTDAELVNLYKFTSTSSRRILRRFVPSWPGSTNTTLRPRPLSASMWRPAASLTTTTRNPRCEMAKHITIQVPGKHPQTGELTAFDLKGQRIDIDIGGTTVPFLIHGRGIGTALTHIPSGYRIALPVAGSLLVT